MADIKYIRNEKLPVILEGWQGNPQTGKRFFDPQKRFSGSFSKVLKWQTSAKPKAAEKKADTWRVAVIKDKKFLTSTEDCIVWLGHASFFMRINGVQIITDPVFYTLGGFVKRYSELPCEVSDFKKIDYVLLSHGHRDHCDRRSLKELYANNKFELLTGLNIGKLVSGWLPGLKYQEAGWYQPYASLKSGLTVTYLPAQHWSNRYPWDLNETLWGSMMIQGGPKQIFFGGDSGYCDYPKQIRDLFPEIDMAMIGVGAYTPDFMMQDVHTSPWEALDVVKDLGARIFIPMHYGTYDLADEPMGEPFRLLNSYKNDKSHKIDIRLPDIGEILTISD
ncbi:MAG: MBL fold metallo-hydrolase [Bacteroidetes bacterium]|nr:MBL fold metallo-hydrolase [Bacteroidota bacterium]